MSLNKNILNVTAIILVILSFLPYWILTVNSYIEPHDNLDSDVVWFSVTSNNGKLLSFSNDVVIDQYMNGIPRNSLMPGLSFISLLFYLFSPFWAYLINFTLVRLIAFFSMRLLLKDYVFTKKYNYVYALGISVCFALLPYWGVHSGIGISGLPLIAWAFINLKTNKRVPLSLILLFIFPFYGSLIYTGVFYLLITGVFWVYDSVKSKKVNASILIGLLIHTIAYALAELNLVMQLIGSEMISHRTEKIVSGLNLVQAIEKGVKLFVDGQYHAPTLNSPIIITLSSIALVYSLHLTIKKKATLASKLVVLLYCSLLGISFFYGFWSFQPIVSLTDKITLLKVIQWDRFHWLAPFIWFVLFALSIHVLLLDNSKKWVKIFLTLVIIGQVYHSISTNKMLKTNYAVIFNNYVPETPSFKQYYAKDLLQSIDRFINRPKSDYRIISVGLNPEIAAAYGFYVLDSYQRNYPLAYKHQFGEVIAPELTRDENLSKYFQDWGSRCYAFSTELGREYYWNKNQQKQISLLDYDFNKLKALGCEYIISSVPINEKNNAALTLLETFENDDSFWRLFLYKIA